MRKIKNDLAMLGLVATMSIAGAMSAFAVTIEYSDENAITNSDATITVDGFDAVPIRIVSNENLTFTVDVSTIPKGTVDEPEFESLAYGYIEDGQFQYISSYRPENDSWKYNKGFPKSVSLFDKQQLQTDMSTGNINDRIYSIIIGYYTGTPDYVNDVDGYARCMWVFKLDTSAENNTTNTNNTTSVTTSDNDSNAYTQGWKKDSFGWWYQYSDGSYIQNVWFQDTDGKWYYFNSNGYMMANTTTPDGYYVNESGAWVQ